MSIRYRITDSVSFAFTVLCVGVFLALSFFSYSNALTWINAGIVDDSNINLILDTVVDSSGIIHYAGKRVNIMPYADLGLVHGTSSDNGETIAWEEVGDPPVNADWAYEVVVIKLDNAGEPGIFFGLHNTSNQDQVFYYAHSNDWTTVYNVFGTLPVTQGRYANFDFVGTVPHVILCTSQDLGSGIGTHEYALSLGSFVHVATIDGSVSSCGRVDYEVDDADEAGRYVAYVQDSIGDAVNAGLYVYTWDDGGSSWGPRTLVVSTSTAPNMSTALDLEIGTDGNPRVVTVDDSSISDSDTVYHGLYNGSSWSTEVAVTGLTVSGDYENFHNNLVSIEGLDFVSYVRVVGSDVYASIASRSSGGIWTENDVTSSTYVGAYGYARLSYDAVKSYLISNAILSVDTGDPLYNNTFYSSVASPTAPSILTTTSITTSTASFSWVDNANGIYQESNFILDFILGTNVASFPGTTSTPSRNATSGSVSGLIPNAEYTARIASENTEGISAYATSSAFYTLANPPSVPMITPASTTSLQIAFSASEVNASTTVYTIFEETSGLYLAGDMEVDSVTPVWQTTSTWNTPTAIGLLVNTPYTFSLIAKNGDDILTTTTTAPSTYTLANPPTSLSAGTITADSIQVSWSVNGNPVGTEFYADIDSGTDCDWTADMTTCTFSGLTAGTTYSVQIKARNGDTVETAYTTAITPATSASSGGGGGGGGGDPVEPPTKPADPGDLLSINAGAVYTNNPIVTLTLNNVFASQYLVSESNSFTGQTFLTTPATRSFTLSSGDGTKTVYGRFQKDGQHVYDVSDTIILDTKAPNPPRVSAVSQSAKPTVSGTSEEGAVIVGTSEARSDIRVYDLDEGTGCTVVDLQGARPGVFSPCPSASSTVSAGMSWSTGGIRGKAISFAGTAGVLNLGTQSPSSGNASMGVWFKPSQSVTTKQVVLAYGSVGDQVTLEIENTTLFFVDSIDGRNIKTSLGSVSAGSWHHVLITIAQNGKKYVYRNGLEVANVLGSGLSALNIASPTLVVGGQANDTSFFAGTIDDVLFSSTVFSNVLSALVYKEKGGVINSALDPSLVIPTAPTDTSGGGPTTPPDTTGGVTPATYAYSFSEGTGCATIDAQAGKTGFLGPQCEVGNAPTWTTGVGGTGKALTFDGMDDYVSLQSAYPRNTDVTVSAWYKTDDTATERMTVVGGVAGSRFEVYINRGTPACRIFDTSQKILFAPGIAVGGWHHVTCVAQYTPSPKTLLYVDGVLVASMDRAPESLGGNWYAGKSQSSGKFFKGSIDGITIWNQVLDPADIAVIGSISGSHSTSKPFSSSVILAGQNPFSLAISSLLAGTEDTVWSYAYSSTLPYGVHVLSLTATDMAGNTSVPSSALVYVSSDTLPEDPVEPIEPPTDPTCGAEGQPACPVEPTCGAEGQPACPVEPTCGAEGQPACPVEPACGVTGKPACPTDPDTVPGGQDANDPTVEGGASGSDIDADDNPIDMSPTPSHVTTTVLDATIKSIQDTFASLRDNGVVETVQSVTRSITNAVKRVIDNPAVENANTRLVAPALIAVGVTNIALGFQLPHALAFFRYFFGQPLLLLRRRKQKKWGVVYNAYTKQPLDLATVRVIRTDTGRVIQSQVTDMYGRYFLILDPGRYRIEVDKTGFASASTFVKGKREDAGYTDVYHKDEIISATADRSELSVNIPLDPVFDDEPTVHIVREYAKKTFHYSLSLAGFGISVVSYIISPTPLIAVLVLFHVVFFLMFRTLSGRRRKGAVGIIRDSHTKDALKHVVVRIFDTAYNKLIDTAVTDAKGRYASLVGPSQYYVTYDKSGYEKKQSGTIDMSASRTKGTGGVIARDEMLAPVRTRTDGGASQRTAPDQKSYSTLVQESRAVESVKKNGTIDSDAVDNLKDIAQYGGKES